MCLETFLSAPLEIQTGGMCVFPYCPTLSFTMIGRISTFWRPNEYNWNAYERIVYGSITLNRDAWQWPGLDQYGKNV